MEKLRPPREESSLRGRWDPQTRTRQTLNPVTPEAQAKVSGACRNRVFALEMGSIYHSGSRSTRRYLQISRKTRCVGSLGSRTYLKASNSS